MKFLHRTKFLMAAAVAMTTVVVAAQAAHASEASPTGANIGFDFSWNDSANPAGHSASFLEVDGFTANNCSGSVLTASTKTCNFVFDYRINGAVQASSKHSARWVKWVNPTRYPVGVGNRAGCDSPPTGKGTTGKAPLTLFDCFNSSSFGQVISPATSGALTQFRISLSCLTPSGVAPYELFALLYELTPDGLAIGGSAPIAATVVNLSKCPTAKSWKNKTFKASDFAMTAMNFGNPQLSAGKFYGIYFTGTGVPGNTPPGAPAAINNARNAATTTTTVAPSTTAATTTSTTPWSRFKSNSGSSTKNTTPALPATEPAITTELELEVTRLAAQEIKMSAARVLTEEQAKTYILLPLTPKICLASGRNLVFLQTGRCTSQVALRSNGKVMSQVTTSVVEGTVTPNERVVAVDKPSYAYFTDGTALVKNSSKKAIDSLAPTAKAADTLLVTGHTGNALGESENNVILSQKRALAVRSLIRQSGVGRTIAIWSYGGTLPRTTSKSEAKQALNRRAEIYIIPK